MSKRPERIIRAKRIIQNKDGFEWFCLLGSMEYGSMEYIDESLLDIAQWCRDAFEEEPFVVMGSTHNPYDEILHVRAVIYHDDCVVRVRSGADAMAFMLRWC